MAAIGGLILQKLDYQVQVETNPSKALQVFHTNPSRFDLIITDMTMLSMTGDQFIHQVLQVRPDMKTIL